MVIIATVKVNTRNSRDAPVQQTRNNNAIFWAPADFILPSGYTRLSENEDVLKCVDIIADLVSNMTIMLMQNGKNGDTRLRDALSKKIDIYPCEMMVRKTFIYNIVEDMLLAGNKVVFPKISLAREHFIENLVPWTTSSTSFINRTEESYQISHNGHVYSPDEVLHFVYKPSRQYPYVGEGIGPMVRRTVQDLAQAQATKSAFLKSKWKPSLIISTMADDEELKNPESRKKILNSYTETTEDGEPWVIPTGEIDVKTVQPLTLNDLAISDSMNLDKRSIARAIGVPPFLIGIGDFNKDAYNNFVETKILSIAMIIQQELTKKLLIAYDRYFKLNIDSLKQYALNERIAFVRDMCMLGIINRNEGRNEFGKSPVDLPGMNDYVALENYIPVAMLGEQKKLNKEGENNGA